MVEWTRKYRQELLIASTLIKYGFSVVAIFLGYLTIKNGFYLFVGWLELAIIVALTNTIMRRNKWLAYGFNSIFLLLINIQSLVLYYSGTHVTLVMVTNLDSIKALSGKMHLYVWGILGLLVTTFLPMVPDYCHRLLGMVRNRWTSANGRWQGLLNGLVNRLGHPPKRFLSVFLLAELLFTMLYGNAYSPVFATYRLGLEQRDRLAQLEAIKNQPNITSNFYRNRISSAREKPNQLAKNPNVVLVFVEGLSQNIIDDSRQIMPNVASYQSKALRFDNYFNHTFATYRGLIGQLYSGYQLDNYDSNTLVSMPQLFSQEGYHTSFINTEPNNSQFTSYLNLLGFEEIVGNPGTDYRGAANTLSDKEAFERLLTTMEEQAQADKPFMTGIYTFGTHMSLDSTDEKFKDGNNQLLNRFYDFDVQFGQFMKKFQASDLAKNTVLIFTTDHATYTDADFSKSFPDYQRVNSDLDKIPFFIYYDGIVPEAIDVGGRNSLDMAPTVLDYLGINKPNYFLGASLFFPTENNNSFDTVFHNGTTVLSTKKGTIGPLSEADQEIFDFQVQQYFAAKTQHPLDLEE